MSCVRAIDFLTSQPDWDGKNVIVQGGSQGERLLLLRQDWISVLQRV